MNYSSISRRHFLGRTVVAAAPLILPSSRLFGQSSPEKTINLGHIGVGNRGMGVLQNFLSAPGARSVAICDPFKDRREAAAQRVKSSQRHDPKLYRDFRELLVDPAIDAVVIATPDHWHVPIGLAAVRAGKDVYIEKPLGHTLAQNKAMMEACEKYGRIFQYGTQQRSQEILKRGIELIINGYIGPLQRLDIWAPAGEGGGSMEEIPVPEGLDYDLYIGPAPMKPCTKDRISSKGSYFCSDYSIGFIAGWGAHPLDISIWGLDYDQKGPFKIRGTGSTPTPSSLFNNIATWDVAIEYAGGITARFMSNDIARPVVSSYRKNWSDEGTTFFGTKGWISLSRNGVASSNMEWFREKLPESAKRVPYEKNYFHAFVNAVRNHTPSIGPVADAVRSDAISHLSAIAIQSGEEIVWDPKAYRIISPESLNARMKHEIRGDWKQS